MTKTIYLFTWNSDFLLNDSISKWKKQFSDKYWEINLSHYKDLNIVDKNILKSEALSTSFFSEKKLIIIDLNNDLDEDFENFLLSILDKKDENTIIIFNFLSPDKRKKFYKNLVKISEIKEFDIKDENDIKKIILSRFWNIIDNDAIDLIIKYKAKNIKKIFSEIEKLSIMNNQIKKEDIEKNIVPELEESIFDIVNLLLNKEKIESIKRIDILLNEVNIYQFYNSLLSNLRVTVYIQKLKKYNIPQSEIWKILNLWNRRFLIEKNYKIKYDELSKFFINLVKIDKKMKTWKLISSDEDSIRYEIEKNILKI